MSEILPSPVPPMNAEILMQDTKVFNAFLLAVFYHDLLAENPLVQEKLFLFVQNYPTIAELLNEKNAEEESILSSLSFQEKELEKFFLGLWEAWLYGYPFFDDGEIAKIFTEVLSDSEISATQLCGSNFAYCLQNRFLQAKDTLSSDAWELVVRHLYNNPKLSPTIKDTLQIIAEQKREEFIELLSNGDSSFPQVRGKVSKILQ